VTEVIVHYCHTQTCSWNQPVLKNEGRVFSIKETIVREVIVYFDHMQICSWNQPVLNNEDCSKNVI